MSTIINDDQKRLFDMLPTASGCKDLNSNFIYANQNYANIVGLKYKEDIVGRTDFDMPCDTAKCAELFRKQDQQVITKLHQMQILDIHPFDGGIWKVYIFSKCPLYDENNRVIGTIFSGQEVSNPSALELASFLDKEMGNKIPNNLQNSYTLTNNLADMNLTNRESEILFFTLRGKTAKVVAKILGLSYRTVEKHLEQIKHKFNAGNIHELIYIAMSLGYINVVPNTLFSTQISFCLAY